MDLVETLDIRFGPVIFLTPFDFILPRLSPITSPFFPTSFLIIALMKVNFQTKNLSDIKETSQA